MSEIIEIIIVTELKIKHRWFKVDVMESSFSHKESSHKFFPSPKIITICNYKLTV